MDTFNGRYIIHRIQDVEIGTGGIGIDDFLDDIDIDFDDDPLPDPLPPVFRMQGATFANTSDQFGILVTNGPPENPQNLYDFSMINQLNANAWTNLTRMNFNISSLEFTENQTFTQGNNPVAHDPTLLTYDGNAEVTNMGLNLSIARYKDVISALINGPSAAFISGVGLNLYNIGGVLMPASDFADPTRLGEFAGGAFYPQQVSHTENSGADYSLLSI